MKEKIGVNKRNEIVFASEQEFNSNSFATGESGSGKTVMQISRITRLAEAGEKIIVINWRNCVNHELLMNEQKDAYLKHAHVIDVAKEGIALPLFDRQTNSNESIESDSNLIQRLSSILKTAVDLTPTQEQEAYSCIRDILLKGLYYTEGIAVMDEWLTTQKKAVARNVASKIRPFTSNNVFRHGNFMENPAMIYELDLNGLEYDAQLKVVKFMLDYFLRMANKGHYRENILYVFLDEAQNMDFTEGTTMYTILNESRRLGLRMMLAFPSIFGGAKKGMDIVTQCGTKFYFKPMDKDRRRIAELIDDREADALVFTLARLKKGECVACGNFEINGKTVSQPVTIKTII